jgi:hypothetical protein
MLECVVSIDLNNLRQCLNVRSVEAVVFLAAQVDLTIRVQGSLVWVSVVCMEGLHDSRPRRSAPFSLHFGHDDPGKRPLRRCRSHRDRTLSYSFPITYAKLSPSRAPLQKSSQMAGRTVKPAWQNSKKMAGSPQFLRSQSLLGRRKW